MDKKQLTAAAKELNEVLNLDPKIKTVAVKTEVLEEQILKAADLIEEGDELSDETLDVIKELQNDVTEEEVAQDDDIAEADELYDEVNDSEDLKHLKKLVKSEDVFKPLRKKAPGIFEIEDLRDMMLDLLSDDDDEEEEPEEAPPAPPAKKKPAAKKSVKKEESEPEQDEEPEEKEASKKKPAKKASGGSHYGTAVDILCTDPDMEWDTLVKKMEKKGFSVEDGKSAMRTAFSSVRKVVALLRENGWKKK